MDWSDDRVIQCRACKSYPDISRDRPELCVCGGQLEEVSLLASLRHRIPEFDDVIQCSGCHCYTAIGESWRYQMNLPCGCGGRMRVVSLSESKKQRKG